ncbi:MAG TPA: ComEC/Rec2 family competence protein [Clostridiales bacterium]|jgi:competence protein ComEC|nr:ComEC/Rec2 family competence protein [Clostridiales bacterium]HOL78670.1 ComEC/Rec2 family competence protein [Clostridiales bacterium]HPP67827.1 ComEC/Rec2 family competence protein [Clostridiales bacterium]
MTFKQSVMLLFVSLLFSLAFTLLCFKNERLRTLAAVFLCFSSAILLTVSVAELKYNKALESVGSNKEIVGRVVNYEQSGGRNYYIIKTELIDNEEKRVNLRLYSRTPIYAEVNDMVKFKADSVYKLGGSDTAKRSYKADSLFLGAYTYGEITVKPAKTKTLFTSISKAREYIKDIIKTNFPEETEGLMTGIMLGDTSGIDSGLINEVRKTGAAHILSVSGLHVSLWSMFAYQLLTRLKRRTLSGIVSIAFVFFVVAVTGFSSAAIRAGIMLSLFYLGEIFNKNSEPINSLGFAAFVICFINPYTAADLSFLLSFFATLGILLAAGKTNEFAGKIKIKLKSLKRLVSGIVTAFCISLAAVLFTMPVSVLAFGGISFIAPLSNIISILPTEAAMLFCGLAIISSPIKFLSSALYYIASFLLDCFILINSLFAKLPFAYINISKGVLAAAASAFPICLLFLKLLDREKNLSLLDKKNKNMRNILRAFLASIMVLLLGVNISYFSDFNKLKIYVPDAGNSTAVILTLNGRAAIIGCGGEYNVPYEINGRLYRENIYSLDLLVLPRDKETEIGFAPKVIKEHTPKTLIASKSVDPVLFMHNKNIDSQQSDTAKIVLWGSVVLEYINNDSLSCARISFAGKAVLICFTPSSDFTGFESFSDADILIARSAYPESLRNKVFERVIISADSYKIGSEKKFEKNSKNPVLLTASDSGVEISIKNKAFSIKTGD